MKRPSKAAVLFILLGMAVPAAALTDGVPNFDVSRSCRAAQALGGDDRNLAYKGCMQDEKDARQQLAQKWSHFKPGDKRDCVAQGATPMPSYVEILTCLEMFDGTSSFNKPVSEPHRPIASPAPPPPAAPAAAAPQAAPADASAAPPASGSTPSVDGGETKF